MGEQSSARAYTSACSTAQPGKKNPRPPQRLIVAKINKALFDEDGPDRRRARVLGLLRCALGGTRAPDLYVK
jgi:hypothetical protein